MLSKERDRLLTAVRSYKSLFDTTNQLIAELRSTLLYVWQQFHFQRVSQMTGYGWAVILLLELMLISRVVVSVSTSRSRDGLETYFSNVSVSASVGRSRSRLGLKAKRLGLVLVSGHNISFSSRHLNKFFSFRNCLTSCADNLPVQHRTVLNNFLMCLRSSNTSWTVVQLDFICLMMIRLQHCDRLLCSSFCTMQLGSQGESLQPVRPYNETNQISSITKQAGKAFVS